MSVIIFSATELENTEERGQRVPEFCQISAKN